MERLWTPWRMEYVSGSRSKGCVLCIPTDSEGDTERLVLFRGTSAYAMLNLYPYNSGHLMIVPYEHVATLEEADASTRHEMFDLAALTMDIARRVLRCDGFNIGMNIGETAGAGVAHHIHLHVVPRWVGDANFMPILGNTMVMPELLPVTYARLRAELEVERAINAGALRAGVVVVAREQGAVVLHRTAPDTLTLPAAPLKHGEPVADAAIRAISEMTGLRLKLAGWAGTTADAESPPGVTVFLLATTDGTIDESALTLAPIAEAASHVSDPEQARLLHAIGPSLLRLAGGDT